MYPTVGGDGEGSKKTNLLDGRQRVLEFRARRSQAAKAKSLPEASQLRGSGSRTFSMLLCGCSRSRNDRSTFVESCRLMMGHVKVSGIESSREASLCSRSSRQSKC